MEGKRLLKSSATCVQDMLSGLKACYPGLAINSELGLTCLVQDRSHKVALFSGGGSGHEPFAAGYVANNMLTGAVSGLVFTSPSVANVFAGIKFLSEKNRGGVLVVILNYTGDQLNFGLAIEHAKNKGIKVDSITINDDCALIGLDNHSLIGKRGILGCAFVFKILGALSNEGKNLETIKMEYAAVEGRLSSMGACLEPCTLPSSSSPLFSLGDDEISLGCGVHGEAGIATVKTSSLQELVEKVLNKIFETGILDFGNHVCVLIGNLGSTTQMECLIVAQEVKDQLCQKGLIIERLYLGTLMSSLDMKGFQISLLNTTDKDHWLTYFDLPTDAFAWPGTCLSSSKIETIPSSDPIISDDYIPQSSGLILSKENARIFKTCIERACEALLTKVDEINKLDSECGDGDCGSTLASLAEGILENKDNLPWTKVGETFHEISRLAESVMGGTSGAVYSLLLQGAAGSPETWRGAWEAALTTLARYSPARVGHRTLVDALAPACEAYNQHIVENGEGAWRDALRLAVGKANEGCANTLKLQPKLGRAVYAESSRISSVDAGAFGVTVWLGAIAETLLSTS